MRTEKFNVTGMTCAACSAHVEKAVAAVEGVSEAHGESSDNSMSVQYDAPASAQAICQAVQTADMEPVRNRKRKQTYRQPGRHWKITKRRSWPRD